MTADDRPDGPVTAAGAAGAVGAAEVGARVVASVRSTLWPEVQPLAERFAAAGHRLYLVGGTVRDLVAGDAGPAFDLDATTTATPAEIKRLIADWADAVWTQGERFGTIGAMKTVARGAGTPTDGATLDGATLDGATLDGATSDGATVDGGSRIWEITTHRAEAYVSDSRKPDVVFSDDVVADLSRRDFTVNAMAVEVTTSSPVLVDPFGGAGDLAARVLRTPLAPAESFGDDPLRMLRAARFLTRYDLVPVPELTEAVRTMGARLSIVSAERVRDELDKLLVTRTPAPGLRFLADTGLLAHAVTELGALSGAQRERTLAVVGAAGPAPAGWWGGAPELRLVRWAALLVELDVADVRRVLRSLRASNDDVAAIAAVVGGVRRWFGAAAAVVADGWSPEEVRRVVRDASGRLAEVLAVADAVERATSMSGGPSTVAGPSDPDGPGRSVAAWLDVAGRVRDAGEDLDNLSPSLDGAAVMELLGIGPGPLVGRALGFLADRRLVDGPLPPDRAGELLREWWHHHSG